MLVNVDYCIASTIFEIINAIPHSLIRCTETVLSASSVRGITCSWNHGLPEDIFKNSLGSYT